eukprot:3417853-Rhodomonas_salina.1
MRMPRWGEDAEMMTRWVSEEMMTRRASTSTFATHAAAASSTHQVRLLGLCLGSRIESLESRV